MEFLIFLSSLIMPGMFLTIILYGYLSKVDLYESFKDGAKEGIQTVVEIFPTLLGLMVSVSILRTSGFLELISSLLLKPMEFIGYPVEAVPLTLMRLVSSSSATTLLIDIYKKYGTDSFLGTFVSIMMSSTETIFYTMSIYFMSVNITKTRYTLAGALIANLAGIVSALYITNLMFK